MNQDRLHALKILTALFDRKGSLKTHLGACPEASPSLKALCFGVCRYAPRLEVIAQYLLAKKPKETALWVLLLMGLYQLQYMQMPDYAVVQETVALLDQIKKKWAKGFINGVLRTFCRKKEQIFAALQGNEVFRLNHPAWLIERIKADWPSEWPVILEANDAHPPMTLRVNRRYSSSSEYLLQLQAAGFEASLHPEAAEALTLTKPCSVHLLPDFSNGACSVQDASAQLAASFLDLQPGLRLLDACAAPGGKTAHFLERERQLKACVAVEAVDLRLQRMRENMDRLQLSASLFLGDSRKVKTWWDGSLFDRILLDAPCSATGVIRRHPDIKILRSEKEIAELVLLQAELLEALWPLLEKGGLMLYATCSVLQEEGELQIARFLQEHEDASLCLKPASYAVMKAHGLYVLPGTLGMDGFFYSLLKKK